MTMKSALFCSFVLLTSGAAHAWGRRGHQIVGETAAQLVGDEVGAAGISAHSFDIAYYANIPDLQWKRPATFDLERPQHYMDMDRIDPVLKKHTEIKNPLALSRTEFGAKFPELGLNDGGAFWRVRELLTRLEGVAKRLREEKLDTPARHKLQQEWIFTAGIMAHYVGDLSMPLHVVEDYDAHKSGQAGVHRFFEDLCVNYEYPQLASRVMVQSKRAWPAYKKKNAKTDVLELLRGLADESTKILPTMLKIDKTGHRNVARDCPRFQDMIHARLVASTLILAELYRRNLGWTFDDERFFNVFEGEPAFIPLGDGH